MTAISVRPFNPSVSVTILFISIHVLSGGSLGSCIDEERS